MPGIYFPWANWMQRMWLGVVPQVSPNYVSYALLRFEINIRAAGVLGIVGAGIRDVQILTLQGETDAALAALREAGVPMIASSDAGIPGVMHDRLAGGLAAFARFARLSPVEALRSATSDAARALGTTQRIMGYKVHKYEIDPKQYAR